MNKIIDKGKGLKNLLLIGPPGCGKTTVIRKVVEQSSSRMMGFFTTEIRKRGKRIGFVIETLSGQRSLLAHRDFGGPLRIGPYGVSLENIDTVAVDSIQGSKGSALIVIDEIGKMECLSEKFRDTVTFLLASEIPVLGTIPLRGGSFIKRIVERMDVAIIEVNSNNRNGLPKKIIEILHDLEE
jgi:nucleoside-triphosphatase